MTDILFPSELIAGILLLILAYGSATRRKWLLRRDTYDWMARRPRLFLSTILGLTGVGLLIATQSPFLAFFVGALAVVSIAAFLVVGRKSISRQGVFTALGVLLFAGVTTALQPLGLKVILLPKADPLPFAHVPSQILKVYDEGVWFEGVTSGPDGTLYLSANRGLNFSASKYYQDALGEVIARSPNGEERILFSTPRGNTAGVTAIGEDGSIYVASHGNVPGIWRLPPTGKASRLTNLPSGAWPNGLAFGPDGMLYSTDSNLARIWQIDPVTGQARVALQDERLAARRLVALAPGANGLQFSGKKMFVTVSDSTEVLEYNINDDGRFGDPKLITSGIPGDDFAIGPDGSLFITTHPYDTLVRVDPHGFRTVIAGPQQQVIGATDAAFGRTKDDSRILYVVTDGGAFSGGSQTRGALLALRPYS